MPEIEPVKDHEEEESALSRTVTVEPFLFLFMLATIAHLTTIPQLILVKVCNLYFNETVCSGVFRTDFEKEQNSVHKIASLWDISLKCTTLIPALVIVVFMGPITDKIGRRKILLIQPIIRGLQSLLLIVNSYFLDLSPAFLIFATLITGFAGGLQGGLMPAYAYIADVTKKDKSRSIRLTVLEGVIFLSAGLGGFLGGMLVQNVGYTYTYVVTFVLSAVNFLYLWCLLPDEHKNKETPDKNNKTEITDVQTQQDLSKWRRFTYQLNEYVSTLKLVFKNRTTRSTIIALVTVMMFYELAHTGYDYVLPFYTKHSPFNFSAEKVGNFVLADHISKSLGLLVVFNIVLRYVSISDYLLLIIGFTMQIAMYLTVGSANSTTMLYCALILGSGSALPGGLLTSVITKRVPSELHGSAVGLLAISKTISAIFASIVSESSYSASVGSNAGLVYYILASGLTFSIVILIGLIYNNFREEKKGQEELAKEEKTSLLHNPVEASD